MDISRFSLHFGGSIAYYLTTQLIWLGKPIHPQSAPLNISSNIVSFLENSGNIYFGFKGLFGPTVFIYGCGLIFIFGSILVLFWSLLIL